MAESQADSTTVKRILVAEDSFALANLLTFVLRTAGYTVDIYRTGDGAEQAATSTAYDLILLDQQMPKKTGLEVIEILRRSGPNMSTPVLLCTAKSHELGSQEAIERLGISRIFHKPFSPKELVQHLNEVLFVAL